jgi:hypothetical protein
MFLECARWLQLFELDCKKGPRAAPVRALATMMAPNRIVPVHFSFSVGTSAILSQADFKNANRMVVFQMCEHPCSSCVQHQKRKEESPSTCHGPMRPWQRLCVCMPPAQLCISVCSTKGCTRAYISAAVQEVTCCVKHNPRYGSLGHMPLPFGYMHQVECTCMMEKTPWKICSRTFSRWREQIHVFLRDCHVSVHIRCQHTSNQTNIHIHTYTYTYMHTCINILIHIYTYTCTCSHERLRTYKWTHIYRHTHIAHTRIHSHTHT